MHFSEETRKLPSIKGIRCLPAINYTLSAPQEHTFNTFCTPDNNQHSGAGEHSRNDTVRKGEITGCIKTVKWINGVHRWIMVAEGLQGPRDEEHDGICQGLRINV